MGPVVLLTLDEQTGSERATRSRPLSWWVMGFHRTQLPASKAPAIRCGETEARA